MKKKILLAALLSLLLTLGLSAVSFADSPYPAKPYKVTVYSGKQGHFTKTEKGGTLNSSGTVWYNYYAPGEHVEISRSILGFVPANDSKYYDRGFRIAGHDNDEIEDESNQRTAVYYTTLEFDADQDVDYEVAYGLKGAMVAYTINYQDSSGRSLHASDTYYGMKGDKPVVSYRYVEGYYPNAYTQGKTLVEDESKNVFTFTYTAIPVTTTTTTVRQASTPGTTSNSAGSTGTSNAATAARRATTSSTSSSTANRSTTGSTTASSSGSTANRSTTGQSSSSSSSSNRTGNDSGSSSSANSDNNTSTIDNNDVPLAQQPEQYIDIDESPKTFGEFVSEHKVPFIAGGAGLLAAIIALIVGLTVHSKNKKKREAEEAAEAEEQSTAQPAGQ